MIARRRWPRRLAAFALVLVALVALRIVLGKTLGDWVLARERARFTRAMGPTEPGILESPGVPESENAVPAIDAAVADLDLDQAARNLLVDSFRADATDRRRSEAVDELLEARRAALATLAQAAARPRSSFGPRSELFHGGHVDPTEWLTGVRLVAADAERALVIGDERRLLAALATLHGLSVVPRREPLPVFAMVGEAIETRYLDLLQRALGAPHSGALLTATARQLAAFSALPTPRDIAIGEAEFGLDMLQRTPFGPRFTGTVRERIEALLWPWSAGHVEAGALAGWRELAEIAATPQIHWPSDREIVARRPGTLRRWLDPTVPFETVRTILVPDLLTIVRRQQLLASSEQLARLAVAVASHRAIHGALPPSIAELAEAGRRDAASGSLPRYELSPDGAATLALPAAGELVERELTTAPAGQRHVYERRLRLLRWRIPPPAAATAP